MSGTLKNGDGHPTEDNGARKAVGADSQPTTKEYRDVTQLKPLNSFGVSAHCKSLRIVEHTQDLEQLRFDPQLDLVLGGGSNVLLAGDVGGQVLRVGIRERSLQSLDNGRVRVRLGAGENWHQAVRWTLEKGLSGLENLSLIPGLCGAAPLQNIGAYGVELASVLHQVEAWDWQTRRLGTFDRQDCGLAYRDSRFKSGEPGRYLITALELELSTQAQFQPQLDYTGLTSQLEKMAISNPTAGDISNAVIALRQRKLPDPEVLGNAGSFFKNPLLDQVTANRLGEAHPGIPLYPAGDDRWKSSAGWLIEACGWKGFREGDAGVAAQHALVLVNYGDASGQELLELAMRIRDSVKDRFGITLENEPRVIGAGSNGDLP